MGERARRPSAKAAPKKRGPADVRDEHDEHDEHDEPRRGAFPIVGVGASAGGLEAFTELLKALPSDTGMGFVLIQHLDPDHESQLVQILARVTSLPVREIVNDEPVRPNHVYLIAPGTNLTLVAGVLKTEPRERTRAPHRPIDSFFESLAEDQRERAVGVVLSGTASDGTRGLLAIRAEGGVTFAQDGSAKYDSMPRSAVAAGCVDLVLSPMEIAQELARIAKHPAVAGQALRPIRKRGDPTEDARASATAPARGRTPLSSGGKGTSRAVGEPPHAGDDEAGYKKVLSLLRSHSGVDFSLYKSPTLQRRINRRLVLAKQATVEAYAGLLRGNVHELDALYSDVLISVTSFFRNPETFDALQRLVLPELLKLRGDEPLRCWVLGCSTGQEAYSIAMAFTEAADSAPQPRQLQIFATDLNDALLEKARRGLYAKSLTEGITPQRLRRFFVEEDGGYRVAKSLREMVIFARQNLIVDPPFSRMDLISCRNLLIYLEPSLQKKAIPTFHYALKPGGYLLLGASESIGGFTDLFEPMDKKYKIYSKKTAPFPALALPLKRERGEVAPAAHSPLPMRNAEGPALAEGFGSELNAQREADRVTVNQFAPPGVLVNAELAVLQFRGPTGAFLEPPIGRASFDVLKMAREGLMLPLRSAVNQAKKENKTTRRDNVGVKRSGETHRVNLEVIPLKNLRERCYLILFEDADTARTERGPEPGPKRARKGRAPRVEEPGRVAELERELSELREYLQSMQEQHDAANEEVQSANEEVQSANEELQSINEELETSKEELESANEELTTVNEEMSNRNLELHRLNNDLLNLQASTKLAVVLFGRDLTIRRFSPEAEKQFDLVLADVGRPIGHLRHGLVELAPSLGATPSRAAGVTGVPLDLERIAIEVIAEVREQEREVLDKAGRWRSVRLRPYLTLDNKVDGALMVLTDIDALKRSEQAILASRDYAENIVETVRTPLLVLDAALRVESANRAFYRMFRVQAAETCGRLVFDLGNRQWDIPRLRELLGKVTAQDTTVEDFAIEHDFTTIGPRTMLFSARRMHAPVAARERILISIEDVTDRARAELAQVQSEERYRTLVAQVEEYAIFRTDAEGRPTTWNEGVKQVLGFDEGEFLGGDVTEAMFTPEDTESGAPRRELDEAASTGSVGNNRWMRRKSGERFFAAGVTTALKGARGELVGFTKVLRDQTETLRADEARLRLEKDLRKSTTELAEASTRKNEFLAMLGHELRNPLSALSYGLALAGKLPDDNPRRRELRAMMERQTGRINAVLDQLLDIARVTSGKVELSMARVDLADVVRAAAETIRPLMESQRHTLTLTMPPEPSAFVRCDAVRMAQVIENLLTNAAKYTPPGGQIDLSLELISDDKVRLAVQDNGIGISAELLPHIFGLFTQAPQTLDRSMGGLGLGLALVQRLVLMHGGEITASSAGLGRGSAFVVTLPRAPEEHAEVHARGPAIVEPEAVRAHRILIVDDGQDIRETLAAVLEAEGHEALTAEDGPAALGAIGTFNPDVVLLDLGLPGMDGYEIARRLRAEHPNKRMLLVAVTGYQGDAERLKQAGFDAHLIKPPNLQKLSHMLAAWDRAER